MVRKQRKKITIGVIFGGRSGEHEVSLVSAASVIKALDKKKYQVIPIGITKDGRWITDKPLVALKSGKPHEQGSRLMPEKILTRCDVAFPVLHGSYGEDGTIQGMFEMANVAYVGGGVLGSATAMDKVIQKQLCDQAGLPSVAYVWFLSKEWRRNKAAILHQISKKLKYPIFTKPANLGSSVGIGKCHNQRELIAGINEAARYDRKIIVEQGIENIHEIEVAVLGNDRPRASVPGEIIASNEFYDYDAKYVDGKSQAIIPAQLPRTVAREIQRIALAAFASLDLSGMARVDFLVKKGNHKIYLNEINTIPGFTAISMYPKLWAASGVPYRELLDRLIEFALERHSEKARLATSYQPKEDWHLGQ